MLHETKKEPVYRCISTFGVLSLLISFSFLQIFFFRLKGSRIMGFYHEACGVAEKN